jgi:hypothetical protein
MFATLPLRPTKDRRGKSRHSDDTGHSVVGIGTSER